MGGGGEGQQQPSLCCICTQLSPHTQSHPIPHPLLQELTIPRARNMVVVRPAVHPYQPDGLFAQFCLPVRAAARLRGHPALATLLPQATWVDGAAEA